MLKKISLLLFSFFSFTIVLYAKPTPQISSEGAILIEPTTGKILYSKNANEKFFPASTTKILSTLILIEDINPADIIKKSTESIKNVPTDSSHIGLSAGDTYLAEDGFHAILMESDNFVAYDMAIKDAGTMANFITKMNNKARTLGAYHSNFVNPHGYHDPNHYTTPYDLSKIAIGAFSNKTFEKIAGTAEYVFKTGNTNKTFSLKHTAPLLDKTSKFYNPNITGAKTGFHDDAKRTLVAKAHYNNIDLIAVVMKTSTPNQFIDINNLFDYGSSNFSMLTDATGAKSIENHSYSPWAKPYVEYALSNKWITASTDNYSDPINKDEFISLLINAIPNQYATILNQYVKHPNAKVSRDLLPLTRGNVALILSQMVHDLNLNPVTYYASTNIPDIVDQSQVIKNAIYFTTRINLLGKPDMPFNPNEYLTYEQALSIAYNLEHIFKNSLPNIFIVTAQ